VVTRNLIGRLLPATLWQRRGVLIWNLENSIPESVAQLAKWGPEYGWKVAAIKVHDGQFRYQGESKRNLDPSRWKVLRDAGWTVGAWGWNTEEPEAECDLIYELWTQLRFSFYIADAEAPYEYSIGPGKFSPEQYGRSKRFVHRFREHFPSLPAAITSYGLASLHDIDWHAWRAGGFRFLPQAYFNESAQLDPATCYRVGGRYFPQSWVHPMIGVYAGARGWIPLNQWRTLLEDAGSLGFTVFPASGMSELACSILGKSSAAR
jgi:hypothetical protein